jgi:hypothetical protein
MRARLLTACLAAIVLLATPSVAMAQPTPTPVVEPTVTVSLFGVDIVLGITLDDTGHLHQVDLVSPTDPDNEATVSSHKVRFVLASDGTRVDVKAGHGKLSTKVKATALTDLAGTHKWEGLLFGATGPTVSVVFRVAGEGGVPEILDVAVLPLGLVVNESSSTEADDDETETKYKIDFEWTDSGETHEARIYIKVEVENEDGQEQAKLKVTAKSDLLVGTFAATDGDPAVTGAIVIDCDGHDDDDDDDGDDDSDDGSHHDDDDCDDDHDDDHHDDDDDDDHHGDRHDDDDDDDHVRGRGDSKPHKS